MIKTPFQWQVAQAELDPVRDSEQRGKRPVLIISQEDINESISIVTVLPLTTFRPGRRIYSTEVFLPAKKVGQPNDSIIMAHQIRTISKGRLKRSYGYLQDEELREKVRYAMRIHLDLDEG